VPSFTIEKEIKRTPSLWKDLGVLTIWLVLLSLFVFAGATGGFSKPFNIGFFTERMAPIYSLFGTVCLAYEFLTALRNESNKNRLIELHIKAIAHRDAAEASMTNEGDRTKRINELNTQIKGYESDLEHERRYVHRKFFIAWVGLSLIVLSTFLQLPTA
jgi:hypothetical protein